MAPRAIAISAKLRMVQVNVLHLAYLVPNCLSYTNDPVASRCARCHLHKADFFHMMWSCPKVAPLWNSIERELTQVLGTEISLAPTVVLLGLLEGVGRGRKERSFIGVATMVAKRDTARKWNQPEPPTMTEWRKGVDWCAGLEKPMYGARGCPQKHDKTWGKWLSVHGLLGMFELCDLILLLFFTLDATGRSTIDHRYWNSRTLPYICTMCLLFFVFLLSKLNINLVIKQKFSAIIQAKGYFHEMA